MDSKLILADTGQPVDVNKGLERLGYHVIPRKLETADYIWTVPRGRAGAEVKDFEDLHTSHRNGRLDEQLFRLSRDFRLPFLIAMGMYDTNLTFTDDDSGWTAMAADNLFVGRQGKGVIVVRACPSYDELPERLDSLIKYSRKKVRTAPRHRAYIYNRRALTPKEEVVYALLASVRGLRDKEAVATRLAQYPLSELFQWGDKEWIAAGFTKPTAKKLTERLT